MCGGQPVSRKILRGVGGRGGMEHDYEMGCSDI